MRKKQLTTIILAGLLAIGATAAHAGRKDGTDPSVEKHKQPSIVQQIAEALGVQPSWFFFF